MLLNFFKFFLYFIITSFLGYVVEVVYCSSHYKRFVNRGFLFGPLCPIYGCGCTLITLMLSNYAKDIVLLFLMGALITSLIEYYTSYLLEKIFHNKWWDYSNKKDSINGRVRLKNSLLFGIGSVFVIRILNPLIFKIGNHLSNTSIYILGFIILFILVLDLIFSCFIAYNLRHRIIIGEELKQEKLKMLPILIEKRYKKEISKLKIRKNRLFNAFPTILDSTKKEQEIISKIEDKTTKEKINHKKKKSKRKKTKKK